MLQESDKYVCAANLTGMPAISIPSGVTKQGLPVGMQLMTNNNNEQILLNIANILYKTQG
jgi:aspartyl-tRNA(Asn)/glutamyl-tRNA(Gln) amidotransferase subunit A